MDIAKKNPACQVSALLSPLLRAPSPFPADEQEKRGKKEKMQRVKGLALQKSAIPLTKGKVT